MENTPFHPESTRKIARTKIDLLRDEDVSVKRMCTNWEIAFRLEDTSPRFRESRVFSNQKSPHLVQTIAAKRFSSMVEDEEIKFSCKFGGGG
ncbi:MAG: hypothetical protein HQM10_22775 [Candidatus Riflebacteria bacterium]|nr:hypothetical protein [Candidatus Riflebacteria bacterium]